jgi:hypothetical protein
MRFADQGQQACSGGKGTRRILPAVRYVLAVLLPLLIALLVLAAMLTVLPDEATGNRGENHGTRDR